MTQGLVRGIRGSAAMAGVAVLMLLFVACSSGGDEPVVNDQAPLDDIFLFVISSDAAIGENRLPFALRRADGGKVDVASAGVTMMYEKRDSGVVVTAPEPTFRQWPVGGGIFTTTVEYDSAGIWDFTANITLPDGTQNTADATTLVKEASATPGIGTAAPVIATKTGATPEELALITSDANPIPEMYAVSFDDALESGDPVVISFSTPAWCTSQTCGPQVTTIDQVRRNHIGEAAFIHVELFDNPDVMRESGDPLLGVGAPAVEPWNLPSEPWTFIIDGDGLIAAKFEAFTTADELGEALVAVLAGG
ncbi:MAG TPA: hypothetical protein EYQ82_04120 [Dehalococcoidia bacterium]|nr:hypothetical protein [Dehalococcoidia bacterium]